MKIQVIDMGCNGTNQVRIGDVRMNRRSDRDRSTASTSNSTRRISHHCRSMAKAGRIIPVLVVHIKPENCVTVWNHDLVERNYLIDYRQVRSCTAVRQTPSAGIVPNSNRLAVRGYLSLVCEIPRAGHGPIGDSICGSDNTNDINSQSHRPIDAVFYKRPVVASRPK